MDCYTASHNGLMVLGAFGVAVYVVGCASAVEVQPQSLRTEFPRGSRSFPLITLAALVFIDKRQEHNRPLMVAQFGHLYDRWIPASLACIPNSSIRIRIGMSRWSQGMSRTLRFTTSSCQSQGEVRHCFVTLLPRLNRTTWRIRQDMVLTAEPLQGCSESSMHLASQRTCSAWSHRCDRVWRRCQWPQRLELAGRSDSPIGRANQVGAVHR